MPKKLLWGVLFMVLILSICVPSCNIATSTSSNVSIPTSSYPADIIGNVTIASTILALNDKGVKEKVTPMKPTDVWWIVEISVKNKEYQQPIFATFDSSIPLPKGEGENTIWGLIYNGQIWSGGETWGTAQNAILQGQTGTLWVAFESKTDFNSGNTQIGYQGQEPFSYGGLTIGNTVAAYDWDLKKATSIASTKTAKPIIYSHTGYIEKEITFENTVYYFQDGFVVSFPGVFNDNFFYPAGTKVEIKYEYDPSTNTNSLISINPVQ